MLGNSTLEIQKKLKAGGKWADEDAIQAATDFLKQEIWVVNVGNGCNYNHTGQVVRFMPAVQDMQIKPMVLRLLNYHFEAIRVNSMWLEERAVSWEAYKRSPFDIYAHTSAQDAHTGSDLRGGGKGGGKGGRNIADIPGVTYDISRHLSFVLRHGAMKEGITMDNEGFGLESHMPRLTLSCRRSTSARREDSSFIKGKTAGSYGPPRTTQQGVGPQQ